MRKPFIELIALVTLMGTACSSGGGGSASSGSAGTSNGSPAASPSSASDIGAGSCPAGTHATDLSQQGAFTIWIKNFAFHPICIISGADPEIRIVNKDTETHNFTVVGTGLSTMIPAGQFKSKAFRHAGIYTFYCNIHTAMTPGTLVLLLLP